MVSDFVLLPGDAALGGHEALRIPEIDPDSVLVPSGDGAIEELSFLAHELGDHMALGGVLESGGHELACGLCGDAPEILCVHLPEDFLSDCRVGDLGQRRAQVDFQGGVHDLFHDDQAGVAGHAALFVNLHIHIEIVADCLAGGFPDGPLQHGGHLLAGESMLLGHVVHLLEPLLLLFRHFAHIAVLRKIAEKKKAGQQTRSKTSVMFVKRG